MKRMQHPQHGWAFAHNHQEEESMRKHGWVDDQSTPKQAPTSVVLELVAKRKPGRPRKAA